MYQRILVPVDGSPTSQQAQQSATDLAKRFGARLRLVHVMENTAYLAGYDLVGGAAGEIFRVVHEAGTRITQEAEQMAKGQGVEADTLMLDQLGERLGEAVARAAKEWNADLIVVGTHGRRGVDRLLLGSGAEQIIRAAPVPVLVVRAAADAPAAQG